MRYINWYNAQKLIPDYIALRLPRKVREFIYWKAVKDMKYINW